MVNYNLSEQCYGNALVNPNESHLSLYNLVQMHGYIIFVMQKVWIREAVMLKYIFRQHSHIIIMKCYEFLVTLYREICLWVCSCCKLPLLLNREESIATNLNVHLPNYPSRHQFLLQIQKHKLCVHTCASKEVCGVMCMCVTYGTKWW